MDINFTPKNKDKVTITLCRCLTCKIMFFSQRIQKVVANRVLSIQYDDLNYLYDLILSLITGFKHIYLNIFYLISFPYNISYFKTLFNIL